MKTKNQIILAGAMFLAVLVRGHAQTTFTKITNGAVVNDLGGFVGFAWGDFHNSGFLDLIVCSYSGDQTNRYYRNNGDGTFTKISQGDPVQDADHHVLVAARDYDNDGNLDLIVSAGVEAPTPRRNMLYHNNGNGTFSRVSGGSVTNDLGYFCPVIWADYDNDGFLDLFIGSNGDSNNDPGHKLLFHNNGDGTFTKITAGPVVNDLSAGFGALWADYDNDGFEDLLMINGSVGNVVNSFNFLYHNNRDGTFTRVLTNAVATDLWSTGAEGAAWGDYDNDGFQDLFVTGNDGTTNHLYHNNGDGTFTTITSGPMSSRPAGTDSFGCSWGDYDNDGYLDLFVSSNNGHNRLFRNKGDGTFSEILTGNPVNDGGPGISCQGCGWVDYDNDGFLDLFVTRTIYSGTPISNLLYHNDGNTNAWLEVKLAGTVANRSAIGAKVHVRATIGGKTFWQLREIKNGGARNTQPLVAHFGLGDATNVDMMRIEWPSGTVQELHDVSPKQILTITEPPRLMAGITNGVPQFSMKGGRGFTYEIDSSPDLLAWTSNSVVTVTNLNGIAQIIDTNAPTASRFYRLKQQ